MENETEVKIKVIDFIFHQIVKDKNEKEGYLKEAKSKLTDDSKISNTIEKIHLSISNSTHKVNGKFKKEDSYFKQEFDKYIKDIKSYDLFKESKNIIGNKDKQGSLLNLMNKETLSTGGYVLIIHYEDNNKEYFIMSILKNKQGESFLISDNGIPDIKETVQTDYGNLDYACRINVDIYNDKSSKNPICFIHKTGSNISNYFIDFIGCEKFNSNKCNSEKLAKIIKDLVKDKDDKEKEEITNKTIEFCESKKKIKETIDIFELAEYVFGDKKIIYKYSEDNDIQIDNSFSPYMSEIRKIEIVEFKGDWIEKFKFSNDNLDKIDYNDDNTTIVLKNVPDLVKKIKAEKGNVNNEE